MLRVRAMAAQELEPFHRAEKRRVERRTGPDADDICSRPSRRKRLGGGARDLGCVLEADRMSDLDFA
jgi:hypothetical protein